MEPTEYFEKTCDPVKLRNCSQYYVDPCDCTKYYQCHENNKMVSKNCSNGTIYNHKIPNCDHPNDAICQPLRPWERCIVTENRMKELQKMCSKIPPKTININTTDSTSNSNSTTNSNKTGNSTTNSNKTGNSTTNSNNTGNSTTNSNNTGNSTTNSNSTGNSTTNSNNTGNSTTTSIITVNSTTTSKITVNSTTNSIIIGNRTTTSTVTGNSITTSIITGNGDQNTNGIIVPITILLTVFGVLVPVMLIGLVIHRYRYKRPSCGVGINPLTLERINTISDGSLEATESSYDSLVPFRMTRERFTRNHESHLSDPYTSLGSVTTSTPEYYPYPTQPFNPSFDVDLGSSGRSSYIIVEESDSTPYPSTKPGARDDGRECIARGFCSDNRTEIEIVSYEDSFHSITGQSDTTHHPLAMSRPCEADRPVPNWNSQEYETASRKGSSYASVTPAMPQTSDAD